MYQLCGMASTLRMLAYNHITPAVAAMDSCFALIGAHQHGIGYNERGNPGIPFTAEASAKHTVYMEKICPG